VLTQDILAFEELRREYIGVLRDLRLKSPEMPMSKLEEKARKEMLSRGPKSRAFYRVQATRRLIGAGGSFQKLFLDKEKNKSKLLTVIYS